LQNPPTAARGPPHPFPTEAHGAPHGPTAAAFLSPGDESPSSRPSRIRQSRRAAEGLGRSAADGSPACGYPHAGHHGLPRRSQPRTADVNPRAAQCPDGNEAGENSGRQLVAALTPASRQDRTTRTSAHPQTEAVDLRPTTVVRLKGALAQGDLSKGRTADTYCVGDRPAGSLRRPAATPSMTWSACDRAGPQQKGAVQPAARRANGMQQPGTARVWSQGRDRSTQGSNRIGTADATRRMEYSTAPASCGNGRWIVSVPRPTLTETDEIAPRRPDDRLLRPLPMLPSAV